MKEVHDWCKSHDQKMRALVDSFYKHEPDREQRAPTMDASGLIRLQGLISSDLSTLKYVKKQKTVIKEFASLVGNERTPDNAYFGPAPHLSLGDPGGMASAAGTFADLGSAVLAVFKGARAESKMVKDLTDNAEARSTYKQQILRDYEQVVFLLRDLIETGALSEKAAGALHNAGLNVPILNRCWKTVIGNQ